MRRCLAEGVDFVLIGRAGILHHDFPRQLEADDVRVTNALIHMDGTKLMGRWDDLTGEPYPLSGDNRILYYTQEFRGSYGHVALLGLQRFIMPLIGGARGTPYGPDVLKLDHIDAAIALTSTGSRPTMVRLTFTQ